MARQSQQIAGSPEGHVMFGGRNRALQCQAVRGKTGFRVHGVLARKQRDQHCHRREEAQLSSLRSRPCTEAPQPGGGAVRFQDKLQAAIGHPRRVDHFLIGHSIRRPVIHDDCAELSRILPCLTRAVCLQLVQREIGPPRLRAARRSTINCARRHVADSRTRASDYLSLRAILIDRVRVRVKLGRSNATQPSEGKRCRHVRL